MKVLRKLLAFLVVIALLGGGAVYALQPSEDIKPSEKLSSVNSSMDLASLNKEFISNVSYSNSKLSTSLKIDNEMFLSILNHATKDSAEIQEGSYKLVGNRVAAKLPVQLSFINSEISSNNKIELTLEDAKIGKVPIPDFALEKYLKEYLTGTGVSVNGNVITINKVELPVKLEGIEVSNGMINVSASLTNEQLLQYGSQALKGYLGA
mgnify:CR=1 FL=1